MTISLEQNKIRYQGNGSTTVFAIPFDFLSTNGNVAVYLRDETVPDEATGTLLTITTHYTIAGSNVTMLTAPASDEVLVINREVPQTQITDYTSNSAFPAVTNELNLDRATMQIQGLQEQIDRMPKLPVTAADIAPFEMEEPVAGQLIGWNSGGNGFSNFDPEDIADLVALNQPSVVTTTIANNQLVAADLTGLTFDGDSYTSVILEYEVSRVTGSSTIFTTGILHLQYRVAGTWTIIEGISEGDDHGLVFSVSTSGANVGQVKYTSSNQAGTGYAGTIKVRPRVHSV